MEAANQRDSASRALVAWRAIWSTVRPCVQIAGMLPGLSRPLTVGLCAATFATAVLPVAFTLATGALVGTLPGAVRYGAASAGGQAAFAALGVAGLLFLAAHAAGDVRTALGEALGRRLDVRLQQRLMRATCAPHGVAPLEEPGTQARVAQVREGAAGWWTPGDTVAPLASVVAAWLQIAGALVLVAGFRWWLSLLLLGAWLAASHAYRRSFLDTTRAFSLQAALLRRASYLRDLAMTPPPAKEVRLWGMLDWTIGRFDAEWASAMAPLWRDRARHHGPVARSVVGFHAAQLVAYAVAGVLTARGEAGLAAFAVFVGAVTRVDPIAGLGADAIRLAHGPASLPALLQLERDMAVARTSHVTHPNGGGAMLRADAPAREVAFENVSFGYPLQGCLTLERLARSRARRARPERRGAEGRRAERDRSAAPRLGHSALAAVRSGDRAFGRRVAARRAGPGARRGPGRGAAARPRRADSQSGCPRRGGAVRPLPGDHRGPDDNPHLPPFLDGPPGRPHLRARVGPHRGEGHARRADGRRRAVRPDVPPAGIPVCGRRGRNRQSGQREPSGGGRWALT